MSNTNQGFLSIKYKIIKRRDARILVSFDSFSSFSSRYISLVLGSHILLVRHE
ncbi:hypothetical protein GCM10010965_29600 [Caldalkalibacillus thermarum]|nr:hypothetical protein GCM10010965_29600 [Caldalkalibacillus thermarum]